MSAELKIVELDPETWLHLEGSNASCLLRESDRKMCCMGQMLRSYGVSDQKMLSVPCLQTFLVPSELIDWFLSRFKSDLYLLNDTGSEHMSSDDVQNISDGQLVSLLNEVLVRSEAPFRFELKDVQ
jgi:hypothetical protein